MTAEQLPDGIYTDLSFDDYLAQQRLSSSDLSKLMEGPSSYWASSYMNPDKPEREESEAMLLGAAYHCARLEPEEFPKRYCRALDELDYEDEHGNSRLLTNMTQVGERLAELGQAKKKAGENSMDQANRMLLAEQEKGEGPTPVWCLELDRFEKCLGNRKAIARKAWDEIQRDAERVRMNPEIAEKIEGGVSEISILFTDPDTGIQCKIRPDYLTAEHVVHLKTWDLRAAGKPGNRAITDAFKFNGHYLMGWFYTCGIEAVRTADLKFRDNDGKILKEPTQPAGQVVFGIQARKAPIDTWMIYVRRSGIPDVRARKVIYFHKPRGVMEQSIGAEETLEKFRDTMSGLGRKAQLEVSACLRSWMQAAEIYGTAGRPWFPRDIIGKIEDEDFGMYWLDSLEDPR